MPIRCLHQPRGFRPPHRLSTLLLALIGSSGLGGCGGGAPPPVTTPRDSSDDGAVLHFGDLRFSAGGREGARLGADGQLVIGGEVVGTFRADGAFVDTGGQRLAQLGSDGLLMIDGADMPEVRIDGDGTLNIEGRNLRIDRSGQVTGGNSSGPPLVIEGVTEQTRRVAMFVVALMIGVSRDVAAESPTEESTGDQPEVPEGESGSGNGATAE